MSTGLPPLRGASTSEDAATSALLGACAGGSKANGSLMRATPLGVWGHPLGDDALADIATRDSSLSHPAFLSTTQLPSLIADLLARAPSAIL